MRYASIVAGLFGLALIVGIAVPVSDASASMVTRVQAKSAPVCQKVIRCSGCQPVYRCRACRRRPICTHGLCHYRTICGWGPAQKSLPEGARVVRVR
ncbi:MAG: hypothetical protein PVG36_07265 [Methyloceanibacter sp.]